jgi:hypothetical protein
LRSEGLAVVLVINEEEALRMATFVALTRDSGEAVQINMDKVVMIFQHDKSTVLAFESNHLVNVTVRETPSQIYDLMARRVK